MAECWTSTVSHRFSKVIGTPSGRQPRTRAYPSLSTSRASSSTGRFWTPEDRKNLRGLPLALVTGHVANTMVPLVDFLFSGIPERFPRLQFYIGEGGVGWIPYILTQADFFWRRRNRSFVEPELSMPPSQYWLRQFSAGFWYERIDGYILDQLGEDNVLWEDDYPHQLTDIGIGDGSSAYIDFSLERVTDPQVRHKILAGNAVRVFKLG